MNHRIRPLLFLAAIGLALIGCASDVGFGADELLVCGPKGDVILDADGETAGALHVTNDFDSMQLQIDVPAGFTGVKIYLGPPPPPVPFAGGDLVLATIEESFASTTSRTYDVPFADIGVRCGDEAKIVVKLYFEDTTIGWAYSTNSDYIYYPGAIPYDYYLACAESCQPGEEPPSGCTYTMGYWKNHRDVWPTSSLILGDETYGAAALLALLNRSPRGDESVILAHQLITAKLNILAGASDPSIGPTLTAADAWLVTYADADGLLPFGKSSGWSRMQAIDLATVLDDFNNGRTGPGHCGD